MTTRHEPDRAKDVARAIHLAEFAWVVAWLALGVLVLAGLNTSFTTDHGDSNTWQVIFGFLSR